MPVFREFFEKAEYKFVNINGLDSSPTKVQCEREGIVTYAFAHSDTGRSGRALFLGTSPKRLALLLCDRTRTPSPLPRGPGYGAIESPRTLPPERRGLIFISHVPN